MTSDSVQGSFQDGNTQAVPVGRHRRDGAPDFVAGIPTFDLYSKKEKLPMKNLEKDTKESYNQTVLSVFNPSRPPTT